MRTLIPALLLAFAPLAAQQGLPAVPVSVRVGESTAVLLADTPVTAGLPWGLAEPLPKHAPVAVVSAPQQGAEPVRSADTRRKAAPPTVMRFVGLRPGQQRVVLRCGAAAGTAPVETRVFEIRVSR